VLLILLFSDFSSLSLFSEKNFAPGTRRNDDLELGEAIASPGLRFFALPLCTRCFTCRGWIRQVYKVKGKDHGFTPVAVRLATLVPILVL
jgi:hypothetical protein